VKESSIRVLKSASLVSFMDIQFGNKNREKN
jgi:hypothetical protein